MTNLDKTLQEILEKNERNKAYCKKYHQDNKEKHNTQIKANYYKNKDDPYFQAKIIKEKNLKSGIKFFINKYFFVLKIFYKIFIKRQRLCLIKKKKRLLKQF